MFTEESETAEIDWSEPLPEIFWNDEGMVRRLSDLSVGDRVRVLARDETVITGAVDHVWSLASGDVRCFSIDGRVIPSVRNRWNYAESVDENTAFVSPALTLAVVVETVAAFSENGPGLLPVASAYEDVVESLLGFSPSSRAMRTALGWTYDECASQFLDVVSLQAFLDEAAATSQLRFVRRSDRTRGGNHVAVFEPNQPEGWVTEAAAAATIEALDARFVAKMRRRAEQTILAANARAVESELARLLAADTVPMVLELADIGLRPKSWND